MPMRSASEAMIHSVPANMMDRIRAEKINSRRSSRFCRKLMCKKHLKCTTICASANTPMTAKTTSGVVALDFTSANGTKVSTSAKPTPQA